jgi:hypothetical protein
MVAIRRRRPWLAFALVAALAIPIGPTMATTSSSVVDTSAGDLSQPDTAGIPVVTEIAQGRPATEDQAQAFSDAMAFAEEHSNDVGYPWIDPKSGDLKLSAASEVGREALETEASTMPTTTKIRQVARSFGMLEGIKHEVTSLSHEGVPDADLIFQSTPDHESNRIVISVSKASERLFAALSKRFGTEAIALLIDPKGAGATLGNRQTDTSPYWGGAHIVTPGYNCSDAFSWVTSGAIGNAMITAAHCIPSGGSVTIGSQSGAGTVTSASRENWDADHGTQYYTGQSTYRGDVALIQLASNRKSNPYIYRGDANSSTSSSVVSFYQRNSVSGDVFYVGGATTGETGPYTVDWTSADIIYDPPSDKWARNMTSAVRGTFDTCANHGDSGGSVFAKVTGGVKAAGVFSGFLVCRIYFTDIYRSYLGLPGAPLY